MLSQNEWRHDSRLIREAEALAEMGHDVRVVCRSAPGTDSVVEHDGAIEYHSIPLLRYESPRSLAALVGVHARVLWADARRGSARSGLRLLGLFAIAPAAVPLVAVPLLRRLRLAVLQLLVSLLKAAGLREEGRTVLRWTSRLPRLQIPFAAPLRRRRAGWIEAVRYLNDCARSCANVVVSLEPDVIHCHDLVTLSGGVVAAAASGARLVYDAHELETHTNYHLLSPTTKRWIVDYEASLVHRCDAVVTVCDSIAAWLSDAYGIDRPVVVMNAPRRAAARHTKTTLRRGLGLDPGTPLVVYVGSVTVDRGLELTVQALALLPTTHFATVGARYSETEAAMRRTAAEFDVADRVHFVDPVPSSDVISFIADADASVIPIQNVCLSYAFCFPNKLLESVFAGLPVVAADLVELRRFLHENPVGLLMDESDPSAIAAAIREVIDRRSEFAPDAAEIGRIENRYGWDAQEQRLAALYARLGPPLGAPAHAFARAPSRLAS